jgi:hypothetical protein
MSVRKRSWTTSKGVEKEAWVVDYVDQTGARRLKTFTKKKAADNFAVTANVEIRAGIHTADSASVTIAEAGRLWIETAEKGSPGRAPLERSTVEAYRQHLRLHIEPYLGKREAVAAFGAHGQRVRGQAATRRHARRRKSAAPVTCHGAQGAGIPLVSSE